MGDAGRSGGFALRAVRGATGSRKRGRRLKEKTVVPVVVGGKVGIRPKWL